MFWRDVTCSPKIAWGRRILQHAFLNHHLRATVFALRRHLLGGLEELDAAAHCSRSPASTVATPIRIAVWQSGRKRA